MTVVALLTATACTQTGSPRPDGVVASVQASADAITEDPALPRLEVGDELWSADGVGLSEVSDVRFLGSRAIVAEGPLRSVTAVDAATGRVVWSLDVDGPLPGTAATLLDTSFTVVDDGGDGLVVVSYDATTCVDPSHPCPVEGTVWERGVAGLSAADGSVRWLRAVLPAQPEPDPSVVDRSFRLVTGTDGAVLAIVGTQRSSSVQQHTVALDPATGAELWSAPDVVARWVAGDAVVATMAGPEPESDSAQGVPVVLELATGEQRWSRPEYPNAGVRQPSAGPIPVTLHERDDLTTVLLLSPADGSVVADIGATPDVVADVADRTVLWRTRDPHTMGLLFSMRAGEPRPRVTPEPALTFAEGRASQPPTFAKDGYVFAGDDGMSVALDRSGNPLSDPLPGRVRAMTDDHLLLVTDRYGYGGLTVHRIDR